MVNRRADDYESALSHLSQAVEVGRASGDQRAVADTLYHLGSVYWSQGENNQAGQHHQEALEICRSLGLTDLVAVQATHGRAESYVTISCWFAKSSSIVLNSGGSTALP